MTAIDVTSPCTLARIRPRQQCSTTTTRQRTEKPHYTVSCIRSILTTISFLLITSSKQCSCLLFGTPKKQQPSSLSTPPLSVTTFNILAPVHRSVPWLWDSDNAPESATVVNNNNHRESEKEEWWKPRAIELATFIRNEFASSDIVLLQEFWFNTHFVSLFDEITGDVFERLSERRPGVGYDGTKRQDGLAVLINKRKGRLESIESCCVETAPGRIAQIVHCREKNDVNGRLVRIANVHLSFPGGANALENDRKQESEVQKAANALSFLNTVAAEPTEAAATMMNYPSTPRLEILGGDFNSNSRGLAARLLESDDYAFVSCASAAAKQAQLNCYGQMNLGVTHRTHRGEDVSVDHIFARVVVDDDDDNDDEAVAESGNADQRKNGRPYCTGSKKTQQCTSALQLGYLDGWGTRVVDCRRGDHKLGGKSIMSDHRPVTATLEWPRNNFISSLKWFGEEIVDEAASSGGSAAAALSEEVALAWDRGFLPRNDRNCTGAEMSYEPWYRW